MSNSVMIYRKNHHVSWIIRWKWILNLRSSENVPAYTLAAKRVSMGLTDRRKTAKNLVDSRKNGKILTVSRKLGKKELTVKEIVP